VTAVQSLPEQTAYRDRTPPKRESNFRPDIEGLRAVAVGLVLLYHAGLPVFRGGFVGVDVFFVISGFLITTLLTRELERTGSLSLTRFYARRAKRLLPAAALVLAVTPALVIVVVPQVRWRETGGDIVSAALYAVNWRLAHRAVDYLAEDSHPSPVQHYWSLAVEEQYYLLWPILLLVVTLLARRFGRSLTPSLWIGLALIGLPSLLWSIHLTSYQPAAAFFVTTTRMWELAIGAAVAISVSTLAALPRKAAVGLGWAGLFAVVAAGIVFSVNTAWPGYAAALPTLGAAAIIASGSAAGRRGPVVLLGTAPFLWVGALSYSLYLWHWPLVVLATAYAGELTTKQSLLVVVVSVLPAWLTYRLVENPIRHSRTISNAPKLALSLGVNCSLIGVIAGLAVVLAIPNSSSQVAGGPAALGAAVLSAEPRDDPAGAPVDTVTRITPDPLRATEDVPDLYADGCQTSQASSEPTTCEYGNKKSPITVALVGDSKAGQWLPALQLLAEAKNWRIVTYTKSACPLANVMTALQGRDYESCAEWNSKVLRELTGPNKPDYVITSQVRRTALDAQHSETEAAMAAGLRDSWKQLTDAGIKVLVLEDTPQTNRQVYECVAENRTHLTRCVFDRKKGELLSAGPTQVAAARGLDSVKVIDLNDAICPTARCAPVIGNVLVYRQGSHITATYIETLAPRLGQELAAAGLKRP
jgi:peptidoglycan/LPS O-acetylase OafA/YrhL